MDPTRPTLPQRVTATLRAKQYLVFFSIGLYTLDVVVPIVSAWMYRGGSFAGLLRNTWGPLADAVAARSLLIGAVFVADLLVATWLRAGYIRSLVGRFHLRPADGGQFLRLLGLEFILEVISALGVGASILAGNDLVAVNAIVIALLVFYLVVLYADYIVIIARVGPLRSIVLSCRTVRATLIPSIAILLGVTVFGDLAAGLLSDTVTGSLWRALPMLFVQCVIMGAVVFAADVTLVMLYLNAAETGKLQHETARRRPPGGGVSGSSRG